MERTWIADTVNHVDEEVLLKGWVHVRRDMGKLIFIDLRDKTAIAQVVFLPHHAEVLEAASALRPEFVVAIKGRVNARPEKQVNPDLVTGTVEIEALELTVLNEAETPPFELASDTEVSDEMRMKYRYVDLRTERMQANMSLRHEVNMFIRRFFSDREFREIETPVISKSTPEGARDFLVPARNFPGNFYALPQSPQQYKQLLMVGGIERYFQIARCFRDEETRKDRQPEFTQLDIEMSFVEQEDVMNLMEEFMLSMVKELVPHAKIKEEPIPRMTYKEAMDGYGIDRPDLRENPEDPFEYAFCWVTKFPFFEKDDKGGWTFTHNPFSAPEPEFMDDLMNKENVGDIITTQYDLVLNGYEIGGGSIRNHRPEALKKVLEIIGMDEQQIQSQFGHMLEALGSGAPPHGGIAFGLDRVASIFAGEYDSIRDMIAFPKTGEGRDLMMEAPSDVSFDQLYELGIEVRKKDD